MGKRKAGEAPSAEGKIKKVPGAVGDSGASRGNPFAASLNNTHSNYSSEKITISLDKNSAAEDKLEEPQPPVVDPKPQPPVDEPKPKPPVVEPKPEPPKADPKPKPKKPKRRTNKVAAADDKPEGKQAPPKDRDLPPPPSSFCNIL